MPRGAAASRSHQPGSTLSICAIVGRLRRAANGRPCFEACSRAVIPFQALYSGEISGLASERMGGAGTEHVPFYGRPSKNSSRGSDIRNVNRPPVRIKPLMLKKTGGKPATSISHPARGEKKNGTAMHRLIVLT